MRRLYVTSSAQGLRSDPQNFSRRKTGASGCKTLGSVAGCVAAQASPFVVSGRFRQYRGLSRASALRKLHADGSQRVFCQRALAPQHRYRPQYASTTRYAAPQRSLSTCKTMARATVLLSLLTIATALKPTRRHFFSNAAGAACGLALPALADSGVPMDLGPLGLRNGGSGKLNSCPPQGIKRACIGTSKFDT